MIPIEYGELPGSSDANPLGAIAESMATANSTMSHYQTDDLGQASADIARSGWLATWLAVAGLGIVLYFSLPLSVALILTGLAGTGAYLHQERRRDANDPQRLKLKHNLELAKLRAWERQQQRQDAMRVIEAQNQAYAAQAEQARQNRIRVLPAPVAIPALPAAQPAKALLAAPKVTESFGIEVHEYEHTSAH